MKELTKLDISNLKQNLKNSCLKGKVHLIGVVEQNPFSFNSYRTISLTLNKEDYLYAILNKEDKKQLVQFANDYSGLFHLHLPKINLLQGKDWSNNRQNDNKNDNNLAILYKDIGINNQTTLLSIANNTAFINNITKEDLTNWNKLGLQFANFLNDTVIKTKTEDGFNNITTEELAFKVGLADLVQIDDSFALKHIIIKNNFLKQEKGSNFVFYTDLLVQYFADSDINYDVFYAFSKSFLLPYLDSLPNNEKDQVLKLLLTNNKQKQENSNNLRLKAVYKLFEDIIKEIKMDLLIKKANRAR